MSKDDYIHWDRAPARRAWARELLARYGAAIVHSSDDFYRPAALSRGVEPQQKAGVLVEIRPESRKRNRRVVRESLGQTSFSF